jgi:hypothetical protein
VSIPVARQQQLDKEQQHPDTNASAENLGTLIVDAVAEEFAKTDMEPRMVAVRLSVMETTARALDVLALALMQNLGDWHVLNALRTVFVRGNLKWVASEIPGQSAIDAARQSEANEADFLPAVDLLELIDGARAALHSEIGDVPAEHGQKARIENLCRLLDESRRIFQPPAILKKSSKRPPKSTSRTDSADQFDSDEPRPLLVHASQPSGHGISILLPPARTAEDIESDGGQRFNPSESNYLRLQFCQDVHWPALLSINSTSWAAASWRG